MVYILFIVPPSLFRWFVKCESAVWTWNSIFLFSAYSCLFFKFWFSSLPTIKSSPVLFWDSLYPWDFHWDLTYLQIVLSLCCQWGAFSRSHNYFFSDFSDSVMLTSGPELNLRWKVRSLSKFLVLSLNNA